MWWNVGSYNHPNQIEIDRSLFSRTSHHGYTANWPFGLIANDGHSRDVAVIFLISRNRYSWEQSTMRADNVRCKGKSVEQCEMWHTSEVIQTNRTYVKESPGWVNFGEALSSFAACVYTRSKSARVFRNSRYCATYTCRYRIWPKCHLPSKESSSMVSKDTEAFASRMEGIIRYIGTAVVLYEPQQISRRLQLQLS